MQTRSIPDVLVLAFMLVVMVIPADPAAAQAQPVAAGLAQSDPCQFYRGRAWGRWIAHYTTEMLWACEAITRRRAASVPLGDRLEAAEAALERFRAAVIGTSSAEYARARSADQGYFSLSAREQEEIAVQTGAIAALETIRTGF
jgi:hypothetical protein